ncbi:unnamed protein product [Orchesella dallaii]|uniref:Tetratricopeptide repeat protein 7 N-terminal domain-containing protein n=1 Tax=Orchesella dallaii TaxID=48710 RepID=A0ABP1S3Z3_9HEXA
MAQKGVKNTSGLNRPDNEVEAKREAGEWKRVLDLLEPIKGKGSSQAEPLMNFLYGESKLESWLEDHQPTEKHISKAKSALLDVKKTILLCLSQSGDASGLQTDAHILLAKIYYASALYEEALEELDRSRFEQIETVAYTVRNYQLMAEAYAMKAHCIEKVGRSWKGTSGKSERERRLEAIRCYQKAADLGVSYFQAHEKLLLGSTPNATLASSSGSSHSPHPLYGIPPNGEKKRCSSLLDFSIRRGPVLLMEDGQVEEALKRIHWLLRTHETQLFAPIRLHLSRRLAELLLQNKWRPALSPPGDSLGKPKYYTGGKIFNPVNPWEDIFLILLLAEIMVVREGVLNQTPEFVEARKLANLNASSIFDLLAMAAARWNQYTLINESLEKALKFSFEECHIWTQYGLTFHASGVNNRRSCQTLTEAAKLSKRPTSLLLLAAQENYSRLRVNEGLDLVELAKTKEQGGSQRLMSKVLLYEGIGHFLKSYEQSTTQERTKELDDALSALQSAAELDPMDYLVLHWLARTYAYAHNSNEAFAVAVKALRAFPFHLPTLQLIVLLLSAQKNNYDALAVVEEALDEYPEHLGFLQLKAALEEKTSGPETALGTLKQMLIIWKQLFDDGNLFMRSESPESRHPGGTGTGTLQLPSPTDKESVSMASFRGGTSIAGSSTNTATFAGQLRADAALSEIASSMSVHGSLMQLIHASDLAWSAQINIWLTLTDMYLKLEQVTQASSSLEEAAQISPNHPDVLFYRGQVAESQGDYKEARRAYESGVAVCPTHIKSLQSLALMQHYFGSHRLAEKTLQDALKLDPYDYFTWYNLGKVLEILDENSEAGDCMATALEIESIVPILPYSTIPICFD